MSKHNEIIVKHQDSFRVLAIAGRNTEESSVNWIPGDRQKSLEEKKRRKKKKALHLLNCVCLVRTTSYH